MPVTWNFSFQCELDADRTELVELQVGKGACPITGPVVFETVKPTWRSPASRPQGLPAGLYAFQGTAWDANGQPIASHCESVQIPVKEAIALNLQSTSACGGSDDSEWEEDAGPWESETPLDGGVDAGGQTPDAGSEPDAGGECPDNSDRDNDKVADCIDECPDDGAKVIKGQCGCGIPETDQDGDGSPDCVDKCDVDANKIMCPCTPKTTLLGGEKLLVGEYLCGPSDDSVRLILEEDGNLHLRIDGTQVWANVPEKIEPKGIQAKMQMDGNLVIRAGGDEAVWSSGTPHTVMGVSFLAVNANGTVTISREGNVIWTVGPPQ